MMIFNGEIYNFKLLKNQLKAKKFISIQVVILRGFVGSNKFLGLEGALKKVNGMFSIAIWDKKKLILS